MLITVQSRAFAGLRLLQHLPKARAIRFRQKRKADGYDPLPPCFVCDDAIDYEPPIFSAIVSDPADADKVVVAPCCARCRDLPGAVRTSRLLKVLRAVHRAKTGKDVHYSVTPLHQRYGRGGRRC